MQFSAKVINREQSIAQLVIEAASHELALQQIQANGSSVISIRATNPLFDFQNIASVWRGHVIRFPLTTLCTQLRSLIGAGLSIVEAITALSESEVQPAIGQIYQTLLDSLREGQSLSATLQRFPEYFPQLLIANIQAAEQTGNVAEALDRFLTYQHSVESLKQRIGSALLYPAILLGVGSAVGIFLMTYVVPKFSRIYADIHQDIPWLSQRMIEFGQIVETYSFVIWTALLLLVTFLIRTWRKGVLQQILLGLLTRIPYFQMLYQYYQLGQLYRALAMLLNAGIPITQAIDKAQFILSTQLQPRIQQLRISVAQGERFSQSLETQHLSTVLGLRLIQAGERSGNLAKMLDESAALYETELTQKLEHVTKLFEPLLMAFIGLSIGMIVILLYLPIFQIADSIQ